MRRATTALSSNSASRSIATSGVPAQRAAAGEHAITVRAIGADGSVQPALKDPQIAGKHTYWESNGQITRHIRLS